MAESIKLEAVDLATAEGFACMPGFAATWKNIITKVEQSHADQDAGIADPKGSVTATIKITFARPSVGSEEMHVTHSADVKLPGLNASGCTAHKRKGTWKYLPPEGEQPDLPGVTKIPRGV